MREPAAWLRIVRDAGFPAMSVLGAGAEGIALATDNTLVLKIWFRKGAADLQRLKAFYESLDEAGFSLPVPQVLEVTRLGQFWATTQPLLEGRPLWADQSVSPTLRATEVDAVLAVLEALAATPATAGLATLPIVPGEAAFDPDTPFEHQLADLVERRVRAHPQFLAAAVPHLREIVESTCAGLRENPPATPTAIHGDLVASNILVSSTGAPAVLDFGFFSTVGDPAFDAAVTTSIFDMYGASADVVEARLEAAVLSRFHYEPSQLHLYRAAYALATAHCFSASGSDGHFAWCVRILNRPETTAAIR